MSAVDWQSTRVLIAVPTRTSVHAGVLLSIVAERDALFARGAAEVAVCVEPCSPIALARNWLLDDLVRSQFTHLLFRDADVVVGPEVPARLVELGEDFAAVDYLTRKSGEQAWTGAPFGPVDERGVATTNAIGFGCALLTRGMAVRMTEAYESLRSIEHGRSTVGVFDESVVDGFRKGEDFSFCSRWRALGGRVCVLADALSVHHSSSLFAANLAESMRATAAAREVVSAPAPGPTASARPNRHERRARAARGAA